jgi:hypothetical protein
MGDKDRLCTNDPAAVRKSRDGKTDREGEIGNVEADVRKTSN